MMALAYVEGTCAHNLAVHHGSLSKMRNHSLRRFLNKAFLLHDASLARRTGRRRLTLELLESRQLLSTTSVSGSLAIDQAAYDPSHIMVRYRTGTDQSQMASGQDFALVPDLREVKLAPGLSVSDALASYRKNPAVLYAEPDYRVHVDTVPNDPKFGSLWAMDNTGQNGGVAGDDIHAAQAWD